MKKLVCLMLALAMCFSVLAGCGDSKEPSGSNPAASDSANNNDAPSGTAKDTVNIRITSDIPVLDPQMSSGGGSDYVIWDQIFDRLVEFTDGTQSGVKPALATEWSFNEDETESPSSSARA